MLPTAFEARNAREASPVFVRPPAFRTATTSAGRSTVPAPIMAAPSKRRASFSMLAKGSGELSGTSMISKPPSIKAAPIGSASAGVMPRRGCDKRSRYRAMRRGEPRQLRQDLLRVGLHHRSSYLERQQPCLFGGGHFFRRSSRERASVTNALLATSWACRANHHLNVIAEREIAQHVTRHTVERYSIIEALACRYSKSH